MSSTIAHATSASLIAVTAVHVLPHETAYILAALAAAAILDVDHLFFVIRDRKMYRQQGYRGNLHHARSVLHELFGLIVVGVLAGVLFFIDWKLASVIFIAFAIHVVQDWLLGRSFPLSPIDNTEVQLFSPSLKQKLVIDAIIILSFGALWIRYLSDLV